MDSYVLPVGYSKPDLDQLSDNRTMAELDQLSASTASQTLLPREAIGQATTYAPRARMDSGHPASHSGRTNGLAVTPKAVSLPEPAHTMTSAECQEGLGSTNKFFIKSRFAVCSGASFFQTWYWNNKLSGESGFNVLAVGTIAQNSRQVAITYYFTSMQAAGRTGAASLHIGTTGAVAQSWPSTVTYTQGGVTMPVTRTWAQLLTAGSFQHTLTAAAGQGSSGSTDVESAVYIPTIKITPPTGWTLNGITSGNLFLLPPRWDKASYLNTPTTGAAAFSVLTSLQYSTATGSPEHAVALHINKAFTTPGLTQPPSPTKDVPGQDADAPLTRLYSDTVRRDANRSRAVSACKKWFGPDYATDGNECDEYPFASTYQGCAASEYDPLAERNNFSVLPLPGTDNSNAGNLLGQYYTKNRIIDGPDDGFLVQIIP